MLVVSRLDNLAVRAQTIVDRLTTPHDSVDGLARRHHARLLMTLLVVLGLPGYLLAALPVVMKGGGGGPLWGLAMNTAALVFWMYAYRLSRRGGVRGATWLLTAIASVIIFVVSAVVGQKWVLAFLLVPVIMDSAVLSTRDMIALVAGQASGCLALGALAAEFAVMDVVAGPLRLYVIGVVAVLIVHRHVVGLERDRQAALVESAARHQRILNHLPIMIVAMDYEHNVVFWNDEAERITGYQGEEVTFSTLVPDTARRQAIRAAARARRGDFRDWEWDIVCKDGQRKTIAWSSLLGTVPVPGWPLWGVGVDVTARREAEERYRLLTGLVSDYAYSFRVEPDATLTLDWLAGVFEQSTGYTLPELRERGGWRALLHPDERAVGAERLRRLLAGERHTIEMRIVTKNGETRWLRDTAIPEWDEAQARVVRITGAARDITEEKEAQLALAESEARYRTLFDRMPVALVRGTAAGWLEDLNPAAIRLLGFSDRETALRTNTMDLYVDVADRRRLIKLLVEEGVVHGFETRVRRYDGPTIWVEMDMRAILDEAGAIQYIEGALQDVTARKQAEARRFELTIERERIGMLERFIRETSSDLRSPLTTIKTAVHVLRTLDDPAQREARLQILERHIAQLERVFEHMIAMARLHRQEGYDFRPVGLNYVLRAVQETHQAQAASRGQEFIFTPGTDLPRIRADRGKLTRALEEIVLNALAYTPAGGRVRLSSYRRGAYCVAEIADSGVGISERELRHIYETFYRGEAGREEQPGGIGLGLALARRIVQAHQGWIDVETTSGKGSIFRVFLPVAEPGTTP